MGEFKYIYAQITHMIHQWELDEALILLRELQPKCHALQYHVALGGGVLNRGYSDKDLDLFFFPFNNDVVAVVPDALREVLQATLGDEYTLGGPSVETEDIDRAYPNQERLFRARYTYRNGNKRTDVFIC